jgi:hypothetical protein
MNWGRIGVFEKRFPILRIMPQDWTMAAKISECSRKSAVLWSVQSRVVIAGLTRKTAQRAIHTKSKHFHCGDD